MLGIISYLAWLQDAPNMCFLALLICNFVSSLFCFFAHCSVVYPICSFLTYFALLLLTRSYTAVCKSPPCVDAAILSQIKIPFH